MIDPATAYAAFTLAQGALVSIRKGVEFYKECKKTGRDVAEISHEIVGHIGVFFDKKEEIAQAAKVADAVVADPTIPKEKKRSIQSQALENIMRQRQLEAAEVELRETLIYQTPGLGGLWEDFTKERARLTKLEKEAEEKAKKLQETERRAATQRAKKRRQFIDAIWFDIMAGFGVIIVIAVIVLGMVLVVEDRIKRYPRFGTDFVPQTPK